MADLSEMVKQFAACREQRSELERLAAAIKKGPEAEAKSAVLEELAVRGQMSAKLEGGLGTVARMFKKTVIMSDAEAACRHMLGEMKIAEEDGRPLSDHLVTQKTPLKTAVLAWAEERLAAANKENTMENLSAALRPIGFNVILSEDLSLTGYKGVANV
jgi:hypothetical protein